MIVEDKIIGAILLSAGALMFADIFFNFLPKFKEDKTSYKHKQITLEVIDWYFYFFKNQKQHITIEENNTSSRIFGWFRAPNTLIINYKIHSSEKELVNTVIHELVHFSQYLNEERYDENEANEKADILTSPCFKHLKDKGLL